MSFAKNVCNTFGKLLDTATKTRLHALKTASKKVVYEAAEATGEFMGNKVAEKILKAKLVLEVNSRDIEEIIIPPEEREKILMELRRVLKIEHYSIYKLLTI